MTLPPLALLCCPPLVPSSGALLCRPPLLPSSAALLLPGSRRDGWAHVPGAGPAMTTPPLARLVAGEDGQNLRRLPSPLAFNKSTSTEPASRLETGAWRPEARGWTLEARGWRPEARGWRLEARRQGPASADRARCHRPPRLPIMPPASRAWSVFPPAHPRPSPPGQTPHPSVRVRVPRPG